MYKLITILFFLIWGEVVSAQYEVLGDANLTGTNTFILTPDSLWKNGSVWHKLRHDFSTDFRISGQFYFGSEEDGADGIAFVVQDNCIGSGEAGVGIGYENFPGNSIAVEFDTYENSGGTPFDPVFDHVAILQNGIIDHTQNLAGPLQMHPTNPNVEDGIWHSFIIHYDAAATNLEVYFDGFQRYSYDIDIVNTILDGDAYAYWGFTSATGGFSADNSLRIDSLIAFTIPDTTICSGEVTVILPELTSTNIAINKNTDASSTEGTLVSDFANDRNMNTRWSSDFSDPQWISIDLGGPKNLDGVSLYWEPAYATEYKIQTSTDNINWVDQFHETAGDGGTDYIPFSATGIRYVRMLGLQRATVYGYSLWEFEVYATEQYTWSPDDGTVSDITSDSPIFTPSITTTYSVTIPDNCLGFTTYDFTISVSELMISPIVTTPFICNGSADGTLTAAVTGGTNSYSYLWSTNDTTATISGLSPGDYTITVTDNGACPSVQNFTINEASPIIIMGTPSNVSCNGANDGSYSTFVSGGTSPYVFNWSNGGDEVDNNALSMGTYTLTVTDDNLCESTSTINITEPTPLISTLSQTNVNCNSADGSISVSISGGTAPYDFQWSNGGADSIVSDLSAGLYIVTISDANNCMTTTSTTITETSGLEVSLSTQSDYNGFGVSCNGANDGFIEVSTNGGTTPYSYFWSTNDTTNTILELSSGDYSVTVTDNNACSSTQNFTINEASPIIITGTPIDVSCNGANDGSYSTFVSGGTSPYVFSWSNGSDEAINANLSVGIYTLTITDNNSCESTSTINITEPTPLISTLSQTNVNCNSGADGSATVSISGGTTPYDFLWSTGAEDSIISNLSAGLYIVTISDLNNCTTTSSTTITEPIELGVLSETQSDYNGFGVSCKGANDGFIEVSTVGGGAPYIVNWSDGSMGTNISGLSAGNYSYTITDVNNCRTTSSLNLIEPAALEANLVPLDVTCFGETDGILSATASGGIPNYTYNWSNGQTNMEATGLASGNYTLTITDNNNCQFISPIATITEPTNPLDISIDTVSAISCSEDADAFATVTASGGTSPYDYIWSNGEVGATASSLEAGIQQVTITDNNGCSMSESIIVSIPTPLLMNTSVTNVLCSNENTGSIFIEGIEGTSPYLYSIDGGITYTMQNLYENLSTGLYEVYVQDFNACTMTNSISITSSQEILMSAGSDQTIEFGEMILSDAMIANPLPEMTITWSPEEGLSCTDCLQPILQPLATTTYTLTITYGEGCIAFDELLITVNKESNVYIPNAFSPNLDGINDLFTIYTGTGVESIRSMNVFDRWGELVYQASDFAPNSTVGWDGTFKNERMDAAIFAYFFEVEFIDGSVTIFKGDVLLIK